MLGKPKYQLGQHVMFHVRNQEYNIKGTAIPDGEWKQGYIYVVDANGVLEDQRHVHYDIMVPDENCLYKHVNEYNVLPSSTYTIKYVK